MKVISASVLFFLLAGCKSSNVLDESRAKTLIQQHPQTASYQVSVDNFAPLMARSTNGIRVTTNHLLGSLIAAKLANEVVSVVSHPRISGTFVSRRTGKNRINLAPLPESMVMQLQTDSDTNTVSGSCAYDWGAGLGNPNGNVSGGGVREQVSGTIAPDGSVVFYHTCFSEGGVQDRYQYSENGKSAILQSVTPNAWIPWMLAGSASGNIETKYYEYSFSPDVQITRNNQGLHVLAGRYEIGEVTNLRLVTETEASANFAWRAQLNQLGGILLEGAGIPTGTGAAEFAKKPDGSWVIVKLSF